jgi:antitoxin component YwqK of YwqJK toxin-antitoxin module
MNTDIQNREGEYKTWYNNGQPEVQSFYKNGTLEGDRKFWYEDGELWAWDSWKNGKLNGERKTWYHNRNLHIHSFYQDGDLEGWHKVWDKDGRLHALEFYRNGKQEGAQKYRYGDGLVLSSFYRDDEHVDVDFTMRRKLLVLKLKKLLFRMSYKRRDSIELFLILDLSSGLL